MAQWETLSERTQGIYTVDQFESAAYRLVTEQVLYSADRRSRVAYALIEKFERDFASALDPFGVKLRVNRQLRYACAIPEHAKVTPATVEQTLLALVLRKIYDEAARMGDTNDDGEVLCDLIDLEEKYRQTTQKTLPTTGKLEDMLNSLKRWGIARAYQEDSDALGTQPYAVMIRPGIADVLGEQAMLRLALLTTPGTSVMEVLPANIDEITGEEDQA